MTTLLDIILNQHLDSVNNNNQYCKRYQPYCLNKNNSTTTINNKNNNQNKRSIDFLPALDAIDNNDSLIVQVELPGVDKQDIEVEIKESILTIQGEKKVPSRLNKTSTSTSSSSNSNISTNNTSATPGDKTTTATTTTSTTNESLPDSPSIEEFEEGDPTINKSITPTQPATTTTTSNTITSTNNSTSSEDSKTNEIKKRYITERSSGYFKRYLDLTKILYTLDLSSISTDYTNGLLTITIKKKSDYSNPIRINLN